jgi:3-phosphoshikimate 1-carboxyvinyltransferase
MSDSHDPAHARICVRPGSPLGGTVAVPSDKSISHRALLLSALADGTGTVRGFLPAGDTLATLGCIQQLGAYVEQPRRWDLTIYGRRLHSLTAPDGPLNCANAGTGMRLLAGVLVGQPFPSVLDGSAQLRARPMRRIVEPLRRMGADIKAQDGHAPLHIRPAQLRGITYEMPVASAQVKSCLLLAGLYAGEPTTLIEPGPARDHTERMLGAMGAQIESTDGCITLTPGRALRPLDITIPGDLSSAAFVLVAALLAAGEPVRIEGVGVNPTRTGLLDILGAMGAAIRIEAMRDEGGEPVGDLVTGRAALRGTTVGGMQIVRAIDEFPVLMVAAAQAEGETVVQDAAELRVKETDRIAVMAGELRKLGAVVEERPDGFRVEGPQRLRGAVVDGHGDHRVAMAMAVAGLCAGGETIVENAACVTDSFPGFVECLQVLGADMAWCSRD